VSIDGDRLAVPIIVSEGNRYIIWRYDRDIKQVLTNKTIEEAEFAIGGCAYHVYKIAKTVISEDENGVYSSTSLFAPKLGF
jgi:hypothetical protein